MNRSSFIAAACAFMAGVIAVTTALIGSFVQHTAYNNCIRYHEHLSVVDANKTCDNIVLGETK